MHSGTLMKNTARQLTVCTRRLPRLGPVAAATPPTAPEMPIAADRRFGGNSGRTSASELGITSAPPSACTTRAAISRAAFGANPHAIDATVKTVMPR